MHEARKCAPRRRLGGEAGQGVRIPVTAEGEGELVAPEGREELAAPPIIGTGRHAAPPAQLEVAITVTMPDQ